jgi:hypothetical protein
MLMRFAHRPRACFLCLKKKLSHNYPNSRNPPGGGNDVGFAALMEAGIDLGFTALMVAAVSGGQHRDRASRQQKELYYAIVGLLLKPSTC